MINAEIQSTDTQLTLTVNNFKLHSKIYKHGYYNIKQPRITLQPQETENKGIFLYTPRVTRKEVTCFYLDYITFNKPTNNETETEAEETNWINQILPNTELTFKTIEEDTLKLKLEDMLDIYEFYSNYYPLFNTRYIDKNEQIYSMDNYFMEFVSLLMHAVYHEYNQELYTLFTGKQVYDIVTGATITDDEYMVNIGITNTKTGKPVTTGTLTLILDDVLYSSDDITTLLEDNTQPFKYNIEQDCQDHTLKIIYTTVNGKETSKELILSRKEETTINVEDITVQQGENITINATITTVDGTPVENGEINIDLGIKDYDPHIFGDTNITVQNGTATLEIRGNGLGAPLFPEIKEYTVTTSYEDTSKCGKYHPSSTTSKITVTQPPHADKTGEYIFIENSELLISINDTPFDDVELETSEEIATWNYQYWRNNIYLYLHSYEEVLQEQGLSYLSIAQKGIQPPFTGQVINPELIQEIIINVQDNSLDMIIKFNPSEVSNIDGNLTLVYPEVAQVNIPARWTSVELTKKENNE